MSFRTRGESQVIAFSNAVNALTIGNYSMQFTNPGMRAVPQYAISEAIVITGTATLQPTLSTGITSANYNDISPNNSNVNLRTLRAISRQDLGGLSLISIPANSNIFCRVSVAGTGATVYTVRMIIIGFYF